MQVENQLLRMSGSSPSVTFVTNVTNVTHWSHICHYQVFWMWLIQLERTAAPLQCRKSLNPNEYYISWHQLEFAFVVDLLFIWTTILTLLCINQINLCNSKPLIMEDASQILTLKENFCNSLRRRRRRWWLSNTHLQTWRQICLLNKLTCPIV